MKNDCLDSSSMSHLPNNLRGQYLALSEIAGEVEMKQLKKTEVDFAITVADSLLARDKLNAALKWVQSI